MAQAFDAPPLAQAKPFGIQCARFWPRHTIVLGFGRWMRIVTVLLSIFVVCWAAAAPPCARVRASSRAESARDKDVINTGRFAARIFTDRDGLPQNTIHTIASDRGKFLWVGTQDGAARYNGRRWSVVNMPGDSASNMVSAIAGTSDGSLWFGTRGELFRLDQGTWTRFGVESGIPRDGVTSLAVARWADGREELWIGTLTGGVRRHSATGFAGFGPETGFPSGAVNCVLVTANASSPIVWAGTEHGLARFENGRWTVFGLEHGLPHETILSLCEGVGRDGRPSLIAGTQSGVATLADGTWTSDRVGDAGYDSFNRALCVLETDSGDGSRTLWVGSRAGLARRHNGVWQVLGRGSGLPRGGVLALARPPVGSVPTLLVGTDGGGLARVEVGKLVVFDTTTGLPSNSIRAFLETRDERGVRNFLVGTEGGGLARYDARSGSWSVLDLKASVPVDSIRCLVEAPAPNGVKTLWVGTDSQGLVARAQGRTRVYDLASGLAAFRIRSLLPSVGEDGKPALWVGSIEGLARLDSRGWTVVTSSAVPPVRNVLALAETVGRDGVRSIWVATSIGLGRLRAGEWRLFDRRSGLGNEVVLSLRVTTNGGGRRALWVGTRGGVSRLDPDDEDAPIVNFNRSSSPALPNTVVYEIEADHSGRLYFLTNGGVVRFTPRSPTADDAAEYSMHTYTVEDGLPSNEGNLGASYVDAEGRVWMGTLEGAVAFDPSVDITDVEPKPVIIERTLLNGVERPFGGASLDHTENNVVFEYALLGYAHEANARFRTQLVGFDRAPTGWTPDFKREFTRLPAGDYVFRVWGQDYAGNVSGPSEVRFAIRPAPWRTWWAFLLYALVFAGIGYGLLQLKTHALRRHTEILEVKVAERTAEIEEALSRLQASEQRAQQASEAKSVFLANMSHELRTPLNAIFGFVQLLERDSGLTLRQKENLAIIARNSEHLLGLINDILSITKIEAGQLTLHEQVFDLPRLLRGIEDLFRLRSESKGLALRVEAASDMPTLVWGDEGKLRQVLINLVANAVKFTPTGSVVVRARHSDGRACFEVEDTGPGLTSGDVERLFKNFAQTESGRRSQEGSGLGLAISLSFVRLMGGEISVRTDQARGACFAFDVKLPAAVASGARPDERRVVGLEPGEPLYRVLVVDDKWENRSLLAQLLASVGFQVLEAADGSEAVEAWIHWNPDLIWMDMRMPIMDGYEAVRAIRAYGVATDSPKAGASAADWRERSTKVVIIALTAGAFEHDRERVLAAGCDDIVIKPFRESTVFEKMAEHLGVRYLYEDPGTRAVAPDAGPRVAGERLGAIPAGLLGELNAAIDAGAVDEAKEILDRIAGFDDALASELWDLVKNYRFDEVQELLSTR